MEDKGINRGKKKSIRRGRFFPRETRRILSNLGRSLFALWAFKRRRGEQKNRREEMLRVEWSWEEREASVRRRYTRKS